MKSISNKVIISFITLYLAGCGGGSSPINSTSNNPTKVDIDNNKSHQVGSINRYSYIPKNDALTYSIAYRFLNLTTFGSTPKDVEELRKIGVVEWVNKQLDMDYNYKTDSITYASLAQSKYINPDGYNQPIEYYYKDDTTQSIPPRRNYPYAFRNYFFSNWFRFAIHNQKQLRLRVAYALSQIVVAADSNNIFSDRYSALSAYYDLLIKHAFGNYGDLLKDISKNPAMGYYLTFYGNQKKHLNSKNEWVYPDENYAREIMQLFTIGPEVLNDDGSKVYINKNGNKYPKLTYTQKDVNELARVFTGLDFRLKESSFGTGGYYRGSDLIHKMICHDEYHDNEAKVVLNKTIPAGGNCYSDIDKAVDILVENRNIAPYIVKKLIKRLTKSNPSKEYIARVVNVFNDNGRGVKGDLKAVVKAILLDKEIWEKNINIANLQNNKTLKYKEPLLAMTQMLRVLHSKPLPKWKIKMPDNSGSGIDIEKVVENQPFYYMDRVYDFLNQGPVQSQSVFNFYSDDYIPSDNPIFKQKGLTAPEIQIQSDGFFPRYHNKMGNILDNYEKNYILNPDGIGPANRKYSSIEEYGISLNNNDLKLLLDMSEYYKLAEDIIKEETHKSLHESLQQRDPALSDEIKEKITKAVVEKMNQEFLGGQMPNGMRQTLIADFKGQLGYHRANGLRLFFYLYLKKMVRLIVTSDAYMTE